MLEILEAAPSTDLTTISQLVAEIGTFTVSPRYSQTKKSPFRSTTGKIFPTSSSNLLIPIDISVVLVIVTLDGRSLDSISTWGRGFSGSGRA